MVVLASSTASAALAQSSQPPRSPPPAAAAPDADAEDDPSVSEVVVTVRRRPQPGAVVGDIKPELQLSPADIQSYGVSSVAELLTELSPETQSGRGRGGERPVVLLNGRRISSFREIRDIPTEAIQRVDILPEEVALKYGYTANQRVVNIVLRRFFRALTGEVQGGAATEGGRASGQATADLLHIRRDNRMNLDLKYQQAEDLTEAERDVLSPTGTSDGQYRTLLPATRQLSANGVLTRPLPHGINATLNGELTGSTSDALQGGPALVGAAGSVLQTYADNLGPLRRALDDWTAHLGSTLNRDAGDWRLSLTSGYDHADTFTTSESGLARPGTDRLGLTGPFPRDKARSLSDDLNLQALVNGPAFRLPAGDLYVSAKLGDAQSWISSTSQRAGLPQAIDLSRNDLNAQVNVDLPVASRRKDVLQPLGDLTLNANAAVDELSDFGALTTLGYGATWSPIESLRLIVSQTHDENAPTVQQLGGPVTVTANARVFDFVTGQTAIVTRIDGGNPALRSDARDVMKVGLTWKPLAGQDLTFRADYTDSTIDSPVATLPAITAAIQAAFPDRFQRDASGALTLVDNRALNFASEETRQLRWGFNYSRPLGPQPPPRRFGRPGPDRRPDPPSADPDSRPATAAPGQDARQDRSEGGFGERPGGFGGFGGGGFGRGGGGFGRGGFGARAPGGRLQFALFHTVYFANEILVRPGGPRLDLLSGSAAGSGGGQAQHGIEAQAGFTLKGFGARMSLDWKSGTTVQGSGALGDLRFSDLTTVSLRLFDNLGQQASVVKRWPWLRGARVTLSIDNLFDQRVDVRDAAGGTPLSYQAAYLDPAGRTVRVALRKLFF